MLPVLSRLVEQLGHSEGAHLNSVPFLSATHGSWHPQSSYCHCSVQHTAVLKDGAGALGSAAASRERVSGITWMATTVVIPEPKSLSMGVFLHHWDCAGSHGYCRGWQRAEY